MMSQSLSIIIVNWKSKDFVRGCLATLFEDPDAAAYEVLVVDNASFDGVAEMLAADFPRVIFIQCEANLGFAGANNLALKRSHGRYILFLNPDTEIQGAAVQTLVAALESEPTAGMVGARLLNSDLTLQTTCVAAIPSIPNQLLDSALLRQAFPNWRMWGMRALWNSASSRAQVAAISGACMLCRRHVVEGLGGFSTDYFMYVEDMDLCLRITRAGWKIYYVPEATIVHHGSGSSARRESNFSNIVLRASLVRFFKIHYGHLYAGVYRTGLVVASLVRILLLAASLPIFSARRGFNAAVQPLSKWWRIFLWSSGLAPWRVQRAPVKDPRIAETTLRARLT